MSVWVGVPHTRDFYGEFVDSLLYMYKPEGMVWERAPNLPVDLARNTLVQRFLLSKQQPDYLCLIDSDATWAPLTLLRLLERNLPVVSACIYRRELPPVPTFGPHAGIDQDGHHAYNFGLSVRRVIEHARQAGLDTKTPNALVLPTTEQDLFEVDGVGAHFLLIRRDVVEAIRPPWFRTQRGGNSGEDFYFSRRVRAAGFPIHVDLSVHTGHLVGPGRDFGIRELLAFYTHTDQLKGPEIWAT